MSNAQNVTKLVSVRDHVRNCHLDAAVTQHSHHGEAPAFRGCTQNWSPLRVCDAELLHILLRSRQGRSGEGLIPNTWSGRRRSEGRQLVRVLLLT